MTMELFGILVGHERSFSTVVTRTQSVATLKQQLYAQLWKSNHVNGGVGFEPDQLKLFTTHSIAENTTTTTTKWLSSRHPDVKTLSTKATPLDSRLRAKYLCDTHEMDFAVPLATYFDAKTPSTQCIHLLVELPPPEACKSMVYEKPWLVNVEPLVHFWTTWMMQNPESLESQQVVTLPSRHGLVVRLFDLERFFVRACFRPLAQDVMACLKSCPVVMVVASPGAGKSVFGWFLLHQFAKTRQTIVYQSHLVDRSQIRLLLSPQQVAFSLDKTAFEQHLLTCEDAFYIVDGGPPALAVAKTIVLASSLDEWYSEYTRSSCCMRFLPNWSLQELVACRRKLVENDTFANAEQFIGERFELVGGNARSVLNETTDSIALSLNQELSQVLPDQLFSYLSMPHLPVGPIGKLVQFVCPPVGDEDDHERFDHCVCRFASRVVAGTVYNQLKWHDFKRLIVETWLTDFGGRQRTPFHGTNVEFAFDEQLFAEAAKGQIAHGGAFRVRQLIDGSEGCFDHVERRFFYQKRLVHICQNRVQATKERFANFDKLLICPLANILAGVDAIAAPDAMFQVCFNGVPEYPREGITKAKQLLKKLQNETEGTTKGHLEQEQLDEQLDSQECASVDLYFLVPRHRFDQVTKAVPLEEAHEQTQVVQYVLEVDSLFSFLGKK